MIAGGEPLSPLSNRKKSKKKHEALPKEATLTTLHPTQLSKHPPYSLLECLHESRKHTAYSHEGLHGIGGNVSNPHLRTLVYRPSRNV